MKKTTRKHAVATHTAEMRRRCTAQVHCPNCGGDGYTLESHECPACAGTGWVRCPRKAIAYKPDPAVPDVCTSCYNWERDRVRRVRALRRGGQR